MRISPLPEEKNFRERRRSRKRRISEDPRDRAQKKLQESGMDCYTILDTINEGVCVLNEKGKFVYTNRAIERRTGTPFEKFGNAFAGF